MPPNILKLGSFHPLVHPKWSGFWDFERTKMGYHNLKTVQNTCFSITHGLGSFLRKVIFLPLLDPDDPFGHPPVSV